MKRKSAPNDRPVIDKTIHIPLPENKLKLRTALVIALIVLAVASFAFGINSLVGTDAGMAEITVLSGEMNAGDDFTFYYNLGFGGADATDERREVRSLYSQAATDALEIFSSDVEAEGGGNLYYLNSRPNEDVAVDGALYSALEQLEGSGTRYHYLAPLYEQYYAMFNSASDAEAAEYDPRLKDAQAEFFSQIAAFASDSGEIALELLGDNKVRLHVSEEYMRFAEANGVTTFIDLTWMKNAFIADYIAQELIDAGYTHGALISDDGFMRCLDDETGAEYSFTFSHRDGTTITNLSTLQFSGTVSIAYLHDYPLESGNSGGYYLYSDGALRSAFLDTADGLDRSCVPELAAYSFEDGCAGLALKLAPVFISSDLDMNELAELEKDGITVYYTQDGVLCSTAES
ncbi:MAG TPA: hypothetical protein IAD33_06260 [Candidatus Scatomorpha gallistercoris]|nr:hypothetical protein [Candidatus Scatomorpha gallistercoris]